MKEDPNHLRNRKLKAKYGITINDYNRMFVLQGGKCWICQKLGKLDGRGRKGRLHVDHDHATGKVRGLLCYACNGLLGLAGDNPEVLARAQEYLGMMGQ